MPKVSLDCECELCEFRTKEYGTKWRDHLLEEGHQKLTREKNRTLKDGDKKRRCVVFGIRGLRRRDVLSFFSEKDVVTEFIFWAEHPDFCLVEFLLPKATEDVAKGTKAILQNEVVVRLRNTISDVEWKAICPVAAVCVKTEDQVEAAVEMESVTLTCDGPNSVPNSTVAAKKERVSVSRSEGVAEVAESSHSTIHKTRPTEITNADKPEDEVVVLETSDSESSKRKRPFCHPVDPKLGRSASRLAYPLKKPREEVNDDQNVKRTVAVVRTAYCLSMAPSKRFLRAGTIDLKLLSRTSVAELRSDWAELIQDYNLLMWENLFGFELYEVTAEDSRQPARLRLKEGHVKAGPRMRGTLTAMDKLADWILNSEPRDRGKKLVDFEHFCNSSLEKGLDPKPLSFFSTNGRSVCNTNAAFVSFDLQLSHAGPEASNPFLCDLNFYNIACSRDFTFDTFKTLLQMYQRIWRKFCFLKLGIS